jgi:hypothetical protein
MPPLCRRRGQQRGYWVADAVGPIRPVVEKMIRQDLMTRKGRKQAWMGSRLLRDSHIEYNHKHKRMLWEIVPCTAKIGSWPYKGSRRKAGMRNYKCLNRMQCHGTEIPLYPGTTYRPTLTAIAMDRCVPGEQIPVTLEDASGVDRWCISP